jgi:hypothetical protein
MRRSVPFVISGLAATSLVLALAGPASAAKGPKPVKVTCTSLSGNFLTMTPPPTISNCNQPATTGGSGTFTGFTGTSGTITVTWSGGLGTTSAHYSATIPQSKGNKCAKINSALTEAIVHGAVSGNAPAGGSPGVKGALSAKICVNLTTGDLRLLPPKPFKI